MVRVSPGYLVSFEVWSSPEELAVLKQSIDSDPWAADLVYNYQRLLKMNNQPSWVLWYKRFAEIAHNSPMLRGGNIR